MMMRDIYGTQRRVRVEGEIIVQTFNHCEETTNDSIMTKIRALLAPACFEKFDIKVIERVENTPLVMDWNMNDAYRKFRAQFPGIPVGEKIEKPVQVEQAEPANS